MGLAPKNIEKGRSVEISLCYRQRIVEGGEIAAFLVGKLNPVGLDWSSELSLLF
jgi:hypothetical protein